MAKDGCCCSSEVGVILACSGGSNVGQLTNEAAKTLDTEGLGRFFCLAGVGGHISGMVASVKGSGKVLVLDGCPVGCGRAIMDQAGIADYDYLIMTELGIVKTHDFALSEQELAAATDACRAVLNGSGPTNKEELHEAELVEAADSSTGSGSCGCRRRS